MWGSWQVQVVYRRDPTAVGLAGWRWLYTVTAVPTSFANGLMGGFFASLPGAEEERALWALALCLIVGGTPSRGLDGRTYTLSAASLVLPMAGVLVLGDGSRHALGLAAIMLGFVVIISLFAHIERKRTRAEIARDLAAHDLSKSLDDAHRNVAFAEETMRTMLDNMSDGALLYEGDGRWVYQNKAMARLHDMPDEVLKGLPTFKDIIRHRALRGDYGPLETLPGGLEGWIASRTARFNLPGQPAERRRTITGRTVEVTYRPLPGGRVLTVHRDLTDIVEQESRLTQAQSEQERTRSTMRSVLDNMGDGAALYAPDGGLLFHNAAFGRLLDLDATTIATTINLADIARFQLARGDFGPIADIDAELARRMALIENGDVAAVRAYRPQRPHARDHLAQAQRRPPAGDLSRHHRAQDARAGARALAQHPADRARRDAGRAPGLRRRRQVAVLQRGDAQVPQPRSRDPAAAAGRLVDPRLPDRARRLRRDGCRRSAPSSSRRASRSSPRAPRAGCCSSAASTCCTSG